MTTLAVNPICHMLIKLTKPPRLLQEPLFYIISAQNLYSFTCFAAHFCVFTIHNLQYQGKCASSHLDRIGLKGLSYLTEDLLQDPEVTDSLNLLKAGIIFSDVFNTVAPTYAKEILTEEYGYGLHNFLKKFKVFKTNVFCAYSNTTFI